MAAGSCFSVSFSQWKKQCLMKRDLSKKGSVDEDIVHIVSLLNKSPNFFTTSSCSGRITVIDRVPASIDVQKQNCVWLFVSHQKCKAEDLISCLFKSSGDAVLKFEPFVLHVQCRTLEDAQLLAVRSTHCLEVPLSHQGKLLVEPDYINFLAQTANQKMEENLRRTCRFYQNLLPHLSTENLQKLQIDEVPDSLEGHKQAPADQWKTESGGELERNKANVYKGRRKRETQCEIDCSNGETDSSLLEVDECLDLLM
ncbi:tRNA wybutosine-synthesizing protein 3 homolog isoform X2 [Thalassophryne amazonica]|uniref:tRNA wybutosine-synthesizing protein 3 homolog isoform X2 n=1 Tax=Thalassophryne amazonica TaxID=390379 RepID=UPI0014717BEE|nr:tRNA wybutosine-synthesizing protein 3 homolog isoform X2 [Thalassophryne amazonica]